MQLIPGQALRLKTFFANGTPSQNPRPYLIVSTNTKENTLCALNVSSIAGKERKIMWKSNKIIDNYYPPFTMPSFVKLDEVYYFDYFPEIENLLMSNGQPYDVNMLDSIIHAHHTYKTRFPHNCHDVYRNKEKIMNL